MHTYRKIGDVYVVGFEYFIQGDANFRPIKEFETEAEAASYVSYLNGGGWFEDDDDDNGDE